MKKKKRLKNLSVLLIPDDNTDPISFRISYKMIKILSIISAIIVIHLFTGIVFYWRFAVVNSKNRQLNKENIELKDDNKKIYSMYEVVDDFLKYQDRVKAALGVNQEFEVSNRKGADLLNDFSSSDLLSKQVLKRNDNIPTATKLDFLTRTKSSYHNFVKNIPTYLPVEGFLTTTFQEADWFFPHKHLGIDIAAKKGTPVHAAADGVVLFANWTNDLGNLIIIDHLNNFVTYYGHNQILLKKERTTVKKGEVIALLGTSGRSTAPHLHFEIWKDGVPVDPKEYLLALQNK